MLRTATSTALDSARNVRNVSQAHSSPTIPQLLWSQSWVMNSNNISTRLAKCKSYLVDFFSVHKLNLVLHSHYFGNYTQCMPYKKYITSSIWLIKNHNICKIHFSLLSIFIEIHLKRSLGLHVKCCPIWIKITFIDTLNNNTNY